jgi:hypothetical protein
MPVADELPVHACSRISASREKPGGEELSGARRAWNEDSTPRGRVRAVIVATRLVGVSCTRWVHLKPDTAVQTRSAESTQEQEIMAHLIGA